MTQQSLHPRGELDAHRAPEFEEELLAALGAEGVTAVLVDLHEVSFVDSSGLGTLIRGRVHADDVGVELTLTRPGAQLLRLLSITATYSQFRWV